MANTEDLERLASLAIADADQQASEIMARGKLRPTDDVKFTRRQGKGSINETFYIDDSRSKCKLISLRIRFMPNGQSAPYSTATMRLFMVTEGTEEYNSQLHRVTERGPDDNGDNDVFIRIDEDSARDPSAWTVQQGSGFKVTWTAPNNNYKWALEIGLARAK